MSFNSNDFIKDLLNLTDEYLIFSGNIPTEIVNKFKTKVFDAALTYDAKVITGWLQTGRYCPKFKRETYRKQMENDNGTYFLYGHTNWKTDECDYITYDFPDLSQGPELKEDKPLTKE